MKIKENPKVRLSYRLRALALSRIRTCSKCGFEAAASEKRCPDCGRRLRGRAEIRLLGLILTLCGGSLSFFFGGLTIWALDLLVRPENAGELKINGGAAEVVVLLAVFGSVFLFGLAALATGIWQLLFGRRNLKMVIIISILIFIFIVAGELFSIFFIGRELIAALVGRILYFPII